MKNKSHLQRFGFLRVSVLSVVNVFAMQIGLTLTIDSTRTAVAAKQITASELVEQFYSKIKAEDPEIHAYLTLSEDRAFAQAKRIDGLVNKGAPLPPLAGVPIGIKDVMVTKGATHHCWLKGFRKFHSAL